ncbi:MAG: protease HtpX [Oligoflexia bacterium]|nr:protease HtpX [Oligoflexia bacterium]
MAIAKRIFLFLLVNILVMTTISIVLNVLGVRYYITEAGIDYGQLMAFCLVWGMGGAFISLALSRVMAKWLMGVKIIDETVSNSELQWLVRKIHELARHAGMSTMPQVGIYESPEVNAFATGPTKNRALIAVSSGLMSQMDHQQIEGVLAHEVSHVTNGDMVTMTLIQGVVNAFVMFLARIIAFAISQNAKEESRHMIHMLTVIVLEIFFSILGAFVVSYFSRLREFRADSGGARLAGREKMIAALRALQRRHGIQENEEQAQPAIASLKISGKSRGLFALLSTHPPLEERIARLQEAR